MKRLVPFVVVGFLACGADENGLVSGSSEAQGAGEGTLELTAASDGSRSRLPASAASAQLGLTHWEFEENGIYGLAQNGEILAEFHIQPDNRAIESIMPEAGVRRMDGSEEFPPLAGEYYDALSLDIQALSSSAEAASEAVEVDKAVVNCFLILDNCLAEALQRQILFGQSCSCSLNVAACSIFLPLALDCI